MTAISHNEYFSFEDERFSPWLKWLQRNLPTNPPPFWSYALMLVGVVPLSVVHLFFACWTFVLARESPLLANTLPASLICTIPILAWAYFFTLYCHHRRYWWAPTALLLIGYAFYLRGVLPEML